MIVEGAMCRSNLSNESYVSGEISNPANTKLIEKVEKFLNYADFNKGLPEFILPTNQNLLLSQSKRGRMDKLK